MLCCVVLVLSCVLSCCVMLLLVWFSRPDRSQMSFKIGIPEKSDPEPRTRDPGPLCGIQDSRPFTWDPAPRPIYRTRHPGPETFHLGLFTWDPGPGTWDPPLRCLHLEPGTGDPTCGNRYPITLHGTRDPYLDTPTLIQLSLNVQLISVA